MITKSRRLAQKISSWAAYGARLAFALTIVLAPLRARYVLAARPVPPVYKDFTDFLVFSSDISILTMIVLWGLSLLLTWSRPNLGPKFMWMPLIGLFLAGIISLPSSLDQSLSLYHLLRLIILFLFYIYIVNEIRSPILIVLSVTVQMIFQSIYAVAQFALQSSVGLQKIGEHILDPAVRGVSVVSDGSVRLLRAYGLVEHPNILGGCLAFGLILLLAACLYRDKKVDGILILVFLLSLLALLTTFSRSAWLAFFTGSAFLFIVLMVSRRWQSIRLMGWLGLANILVIVPFLLNYASFIGARFNFDDSFKKIPTETQSLAGRGMLNNVALEFIWAHPLDGVGIGTSAIAIGNYYENFPGYAVPPHFALLAIAMETGILGAISYLCLLIGPWFVLVRKRISMVDKPYLVTACALLLAITIVSLFDIYPWLPPTGRLWHWLIWGLWAVAYEVEVNKSETLPSPKR